MEKFINTIYDNIINIILEKIPNEYKEEVSKRYNDYLHEIYTDMYSSDDCEEMIKICTNIEEKTWKKSPSEYILQTFVNDTAFNEIKKISGKAFKMAEEKNNNGKNFVDTLEISQNIDLLGNLLNEVKDFNKVLAENLVSESILDFDYASGDTDVTSLRISHLK